MQGAVDKDTGANITMEFNHWKVHDNEMFECSFYDSIAAAGTQEMLIVTGASEPHINFMISVSGQALLKLYEGVTTSALGTTLTAYNFQRSSSNTPDAAFYDGPTWSSNSEIIIFTDLIPGGDKNVSQVGASMKKGTEWNLKANTKYIVNVLNQAASTIGSDIACEFYEVE